MSDDWVVTAMISVGSLLFVNTCYCCIGIGAVRLLMQRVANIEHAMTVRYAYPTAQPVPLPSSGDPV